MLMSVAAGRDRASAVGSEESGRTGNTSGFTLVAGYLHMSFVLFLREASNQREICTSVHTCDPVLCTCVHTCVKREKIKLLKSELPN